MLDRVSFPLSNSTISEFILKNGYTDYATIQQVIGMIQDDSLIDIETSRSNTSYTITPQGKEMLEYFGNKISDGIKAEINEFLKENKYELKQSANVISEYYRNTAGEYSVHCCIKENKSSLIDLTISVPDEDMAGKMCDNWKIKSQEIYEFVMKHML